MSDSTADKSPESPRPLARLRPFSGQGLGQKPGPLHAARERRLTVAPFVIPDERDTLPTFTPPGAQAENEQPANWVATAVEPYEAAEETETIAQATVSEPQSAFVQNAPESALRIEDLAAGPQHVNPPTADLSSYSRHESPAYGTDLVIDDDAYAFTDAPQFPLPGPEDSISDAAQSAAEADQALDELESRRADEPSNAAVVASLETLEVTELGAPPPELTSAGLEYSGEGEVDVDEDLLEDAWSFDFAPTTPAADSATSVWAAAALEAPIDAVQGSSVEAELDALEATETTVESGPDAMVAAEFDTVAAAMDTAIEPTPEPRAAASADAQDDYWSIAAGHDERLEAMVHEQESVDRAAIALEAVARRVRSGQIVVSLDSSASDESVLASVLAQMLYRKT